MPKNNNWKQQLKIWHILMKEQSPNFRLKLVHWKDRSLKNRMRWRSNYNSKVAKKIKIQVCYNRKHPSCNQLWSCCSAATSSWENSWKHCSNSYSNVHINIKIRITNVLPSLSNFDKLKWNTKYSNNSVGSKFNLFK